MALFVVHFIKMVVLEIHCFCLPLGQCQYLTRYWNYYQIELASKLVWAASVQQTFPEFASVTTKQWFEVEVELDVFIHLLYFIRQVQPRLGTIVLWSLMRIRIGKGLLNTV
jgi:hypothetical protein